MKPNSSPCGNEQQSRGEPERLAYSIEELARLTSLGRTTIYKIIFEKKELELVKVGRRSLVTAAAWQRYVDQMSKNGGAK